VDPSPTLIFLVSVSMAISPTARVGLVLAQAEAEPLLIWIFVCLGMEVSFVPYL
jgi:hypothetical protein